MLLLFLWHGIVLSELGRRNTYKVIKGAVELRETVKPAGKGYVGDRFVCGYQHGLRISDTGQLNVFCQSKVGDSFKLMR